MYFIFNISNYFIFLRKRVKEKSTAIKEAHAQSGINGTKKIAEVTDFEQRVIAVMSVDAVDGDGFSKECGRPELQTVGS